MKADNSTHSELNEAAKEDEAILYKPSQEEIAERAHDHFKAGGSQHGSDREHWLTAESDLLAERNI